MRKLFLKVSAILISIYLFSGLGAREALAGKEQSKQISESKEIGKMIENIHWLGHASFKITNERTIYIDPWQLKRKDQADIILVTHPHYDHLSPGDIAKIRTDETIIVSTADSAAKLNHNVKTIKPGDVVNIKGIEIKAVPAYNVDKPYHPQRNGWVGYIINVEGVKIYHTGDTDFIPEMEDLKVDIALLPVGGTYTMDAEEAAKAANVIKPKIAIPMHWGSIVGSRADAERFMKLSRVEVKILKQE